MSKIAVVIPIHNGLEDTKQCLKSIYAALSFSGLQNNVFLIVVDDGSSDGSAAFIENKYPDIEVLRGNGSLWWSGAVNRGVIYAIDKGASDVILFNNDNVIDKHCFKALRNVIVKHGSDVIIAPKVINLYPEKHIKYAGKSFDRRTGRLIVNRYIHKSVRVNTAGGMGVLIPVSVFKKIGFFDAENFPQKCGDADFYLRAEDNGIPMYYEPNMIVYDNNKSTGFKSNKSIKSIMKAYSYPKGYMNLKIDSKFYFKHFSFISSCYVLFLSNMKFLLGFFYKTIFKKKIKAGSVNI